jgi:hypothetical protein
VSLIIVLGIFISNSLARVGVLYHIPPPMGVDCRE